MYLVKKGQRKVRFIQAKLLDAQSRQKKYADRKVGDMYFKVHEKFLLKMSSMKGVIRLGKRGKLISRYIGPLRFLRKWIQLYID